MYRDCPTCSDIDKYGRAPVGWCGPKCERKKRHLERVKKWRAERERIVIRDV